MKLKHLNYESACLLSLTTVAVLGGVSKLKCFLSFERQDRIQNNSKWLYTFSKHSAKSAPVPVYIEDQEQIDAIHSHLNSIVDNSGHTHSDQIKSSWMYFFQR